VVLREGRREGGTRLVRRPSLPQFLSTPLYLLLLLFMPCFSSLCTGVMLLLMHWVHLPAPGQGH
jgi:hypothetical protein